MPAIAPLTAPPQSQEQLLLRPSGWRVIRWVNWRRWRGPHSRDLKRDKGWIGILLEIWLGASAGSKPEQDFAALGVELKTIPIDRQGRPLETTFVCVAPLTGNSGVTWESSHVRHKLQRVLWIPVEGEREIRSRNAASAPLLWTPDEEEDRQLRMDWEELMDLIVLGGLNASPPATARYCNCALKRPTARR